MNQDLEYKLEQLNISTDWKIRRNVFYNIDPNENISEQDKNLYLYEQEDLLWIQKGEYNLDLGWYGSSDFSNELTGYCIHLYRGPDWNNSELLEKFRSRIKLEITTRINELIKAVDDNHFDQLIGYRVNELTETDFSDFDEYRIREK